jgi:hypothetical protein
VDDERTEGRIKGHLTAMTNSLNFAETMIPHFKDARENRGGANLTGYAQWFRHREHLTAKHATAKGGPFNWNAQQIKNLMNIDQNIMDKRNRGITKFDYAVTYFHGPTYNFTPKLSLERYTEIRIEYVQALDALVERSTLIATQIREG